MKKAIFAALVFATAATSFGQTSPQQSQPSQGQHASAPMKGGFCLTNSYTGGNAIFNCDYLGAVTIKQIYEKGWRIVAFNQNLEFKRTAELIIEEQR